jgi:hypothetical protein
VVIMTTSTSVNDDELAAYFEGFDFGSTESMGRSPLRALHWAAQFREYIDQQLIDVVAEARASGATWSQIGSALGVSHQAAMKRFKRTA